MDQFWEDSFHLCGVNDKRWLCESNVGHMCVHIDAEYWETDMRLVVAK